MEKQKHSLVLFISDEDWSKLFVQARRIKTDRSSLILRFINDLISEDDKDEMSETKKLAKDYMNRLKEEQNVKVHR